MPQKAYPPGFLDAVRFVADYCCELCRGNVNCTVHHIQPRSVGKTIHKLWNCILLCEKCHEPAGFNKKLILLLLHNKRLVECCKKWSKQPNEKWTNLDNVIENEPESMAWALDEIDADIVRMVGKEFPAFVKMWKESYL